MIGEKQWRAYNEAVAAITDAARDRTREELAEWLAGHDATVAEAREAARRILAANAGVYNQAASALAAEWYDAQGKAAGMVLDRAVTSATVDRDSLSKTVRYQAQKLVGGDVDGFCDAMAEWAENEAKIALNSTIMANAKRDRKRGVKFARVTSGRNTCAFCLMLASRGAVYHTRQSAGELGQYHRHCSCKIVPSYTGNQYEVLVEGHDPRDMQKLWRVCAEIEQGDFTKAQAPAAKAMVSAGILEPWAPVESLARSEFVTAGSIYANSSTDLYRYANKVEPLDGYYDVAIHGDGRTFSINDADDNHMQDVTADELAAIIRSDRRYEGGPIRLLSCNAGQFSDGAAQKVSDALGVEVLGPTQAVNIDSSGNVVLADDKEFADMAFRGIIEEPGKWLSYYPNGGQQ